MKKYILIGEIIIAVVLLCVLVYKTAYWEGYIDGYFDGYSITINTDYVWTGVGYNSSDSINVIFINNELCTGK